MTIRNKTCIDLLRFKKNNLLVFWLVALYLIFLLIYFVIYLFFYADHNKAMALNELGDFLAGAFSPIAFLFLYLGYRQNSKALNIQAEELRQSTEALKLQVAEMKQSVEQQKSIASTTEQELEYLKKQSEIELDIMLTNAQPFFHFIIKNALKHDVNKQNQHLIQPNDLLYEKFEYLFFEFSFSNSRTIARELELKIECDSELRLMKVFNLINNESQKITFTIKNKAENPNYLKECKVRLLFSYFDNLDLLQEQCFSLVLIEKDDPHLVEVNVRREPRNFRKF